MFVDNSIKILFRINIIFLNLTNTMRGKNMTDTTPDQNFPTDENKIIDDAVQHINELIGKRYYETAIEVGDYVLKTFFKDSRTEIKSKNPNKEHSFNRLCERSDLKVHPKHLYQMVVVAAQEKLLIEKLGPEETSKLGYSLKVELLKVNSGKNKIEFAKHFIKKSFTVNQAKEYLRLKIGSDTALNIIPFSKPLIDQFTKISEWAEKKEITGDFGELTPHKIKTINDNIEIYLKNIEKIDQVKKKLLEIRDKMLTYEPKKKKSSVKKTTPKKKTKTKTKKGKN
jgi:hypothetical protein